MNSIARQIINEFEQTNRELWGDKFFIQIKEDKVVLMTEGLVTKLKDLLGDNLDFEVTSLDKDETVGQYFRVKKDNTSHIHHYHRDSKETDRLLQNLPSKDMMTIEEEGGRMVTKNELMGGELFRGVVLNNWIAAVIYHDFVYIAPKVIGWVRLDDRIEKVDGKEFLRPETLITLDEAIEMLEGLPYHLGGKSKQTGFDCSAFVQWVIYNTRGIWLPKLAKWQALVGEDIEKENVQKGDLVFFRESPHWHVEHVGILISKDNMIHAYSDEKKIVIDSPENLISKRRDKMKIGKYMKIDQ